MQLSKSEMVLLKEILDYSERIVYTFYRAKRKSFNKYTLDLDDLKQEAKLICWVLFKEYYKKHGKNKFDLKKFIRRGVKWRLTDLARKADYRDPKMIAIQLIQTDFESQSFLNVDIENTINYSTEMEMLPDLKYGFKITEIYKHFSGKDLAILRCMVKYAGNKKEIIKHFKNDRWVKIKYIWNKRIKPKIKYIISNAQAEIDVNNQPKTE